LDGFTNPKDFFLTGYVNRCPIHHWKIIEAMNSKGNNVGIEIETRKFSSLVTPFLLIMNLLL
jgi:hypothetical protein